MLKRVRDFGAANAAAFAEGSFGRELFAAITQVVTELDDLTTNHTTGRGAAQSIAATKAATRENLRELIAALNRTARALAFNTPGQFRLPRVASDQALLNAVRAFAAPTPKWMRRSKPTS